MGAVFAFSVQLKVAVAPGATLTLCVSAQRSWPALAFVSLA